MKKTEEIAFELNCEMTSVSYNVSTLEDIQVLLAYLIEDMDAAVLRGEEAFYYREHHRRVRVLSELMRHTMREIKEVSTKTMEYSEALYKTANNKK